jgi:hypothetical protein
MKRLAWLLVLAGCGGGHHPATVPTEKTIGLQTTVALQAWYRSPAPCGQGPYEIAIPASDAKWGEQVEVRLHAAHGVALHAVLVVDGTEVDHRDGTFDSQGSNARLDNTRCIADKRERVAAGRAGGGSASGGASGTVVSTGTAVQTGTPGAATTVQLELDTTVVLDSLPLFTYRVPHGARSIVVRLWSVEPNDLEGVRFGVSKIVWQPNVPEAEYEAYLARLERERAERAEQERVRFAAEAEQARLRAEADRPRRDEEARRRAREDEEGARRRARDEERARLDAERNAQLDAERRRQREQFCATHPADRGCWGAGGMAVHLQLDARKREREQFCAAHQEDVRCWSSTEWQRHRSAWDHRVALASTPTQPDGPPPAPLAEEAPPKLSAHAEWRPGYWQWLDGTWVWLAGMWRVPDEDIVAEQTTTAPAAPPPLQAETPPPPPVRTAVWVAGFWQWNGTGWVWIAGSYQMRPGAGVTWRAAEWRARGNVHVLIPGGWIRIGGSR